MHTTLEEILDKNITEIISLIKKDGRSKRIGEITLRDITFNNSNSFSGNGIYIFLEDTEGKNIAYIGKSSSRAFLERIGGHIDFRIKGTFNNLLRNIYKKRNNKNPSNSADLESIKEEFFKLRLALIKTPPEYEKSLIEKIEKILISCGDTKYNSKKFASMKISNDSKLKDLLT